MRNESLCNAARSLLPLVIMLLTATRVTAQTYAATADYAPLEAERQLAFPTARGFGKFATGGRGCKVVEVTNLDDSGTGSLRWALTEAGRENAVIVFRVSGIIDIGPNPQKKNERAIRAKLRNVTIAGQTAPGQGILLRGGKLNLGGSENVIIRNLRSRLGTLDLPADTSLTPEQMKKKRYIEGGSIGIENSRNIIIDHCCFGWSGEENMTIYDNHFTTVQWCIVHEGLHDAGHKKGVRGYGCQWGGSPATFHHNLLAHNDSRSPRINGASNPQGDRNVFLEYQNNVNYNWGRQNSCYGGESEAGDYSSHECNFIGNYYKPGPARRQNSYFVEISPARKGKTLNRPSKWFFRDNIMEGDSNANDDNWTAVNNRTGFPLQTLKAETIIYPSAKYEREPSATFISYDVYRTPAETALDAYRHVIEKAGTIRRDAVEQRIIADVTSGNAKYKGQTAGKDGIIDTPDDAEGYQPYTAATPYPDNDHDGMDDQWERAHGLNPSDPSDGAQQVTNSGYTALDVFLCELMGEHIAMNKTLLTKSKQHKH